MSDDAKSQDEKVKKLDDVIRAIGTGMLTTVDDKTNKLYSRPMAVQGGLDGKSLYFFTYEQSAKTDDIRDDGDVNIAFADTGKQKYASITGKAYLSTDRAKMEEKWDPSLKAWFPDGLDTSGICLIRVDVADAQYWDAPNQIAVHLYGMLKAAVTGEGVKDAGENEKVSL